MQQFVNQQLQETVAHGTPLLPVQIYLDQQLNEQISLYTHWHDKIEILACMSGSFELMIQNETVIVTAGEYVIINQALLHSAKALPNIDSTHHALIFDLKLLNSFLYDVSQSQFLDPLLKKELLFPLILDRTSDWGMRCCTELDEIFSNYEQQCFGWEFSVKANLFKMIAILLVEQRFITNPNSHTKFVSEKTRLVKTTIDYIQAHYKQKITLAELATRVNLSPEYFCRVFKEQTGQTLIEYLHHIRIEQAVELLMQSDLSVLAVSLQVGFDDQSYFIKKFKASKGITPSKFRKQMLE